VLTATSGDEALSTLERNKDINLMLADFVMPEMDGIELTKEVRRKHPDWNVSIIGMSAKNATNFSARSLKSGGNDFINKNFHREEFFFRIHQNINLIEQMNELDYIASNDFLTGLPNRRAFFKLGQKIYGTSVKKDISTVVAIMDIDFFKRSMTHGDMMPATMFLRPLQKSFPINATYQI
jgi:PleD family two-component response regulator